MRWQKALLVAGLVSIALSSQLHAATKVHAIGFGKPMLVQWLPGTGAENEKAIPIKVRPLLVDGRVKEFVLGPVHEITDRLFVVRRVFRVNDSLPEDANIHWQWERGGWLLVDRVTGRISAINLPGFDPFYSAASWYRDYVAYCSLADDGKKIDAIVAQIGRRRPVLKKQISSVAQREDAAPDSACSLPVWQRNPTRISFEAAGTDKQTFAIHGQVIDVVNDADDEE